MLSVLVVNWNTRDLLRDCLNSLRRRPPDEPMEVIVVDNASRDGSAEMVRAEFPEVKLIEPGSNTGYAHGNNLAMAAAQGEWLLTLNPDTRVLEGTLQIALEVLRRHPRVGCLGIKLVSPDGSPQASVRAFPTPGALLGQALCRWAPSLRSRAYLLPEFDYEAEGPAPQPMGTFLLFRRQALREVAPGDQLRPFDEQFPIFFNEVDLLLRLDRAGWPALYTPKARLIHHHGAGTSQVKQAMIWESQRSLVRYLRKHHGSAAALAVGLVTWPMAFVRARSVNGGFRP